MGFLTILSLIVIAVVTAVLYLIKQHFSYFERRGVPFEKPHLFSGNMTGIQKKYTFQDIYMRLYTKFKGTAPFCGYYTPLSRNVFVLDPQLIKQILIKDFSKFANRAVFYNVKDDPLTGHLFALDGQPWRQLRHKLSSTFTSGKMKFMFPTVVKVGEQFAQVFDQLISKEGSNVEIKELLARFSTDVIGTCAFGIECNSLKDPSAEFRVMGRKGVTQRRHGPFLTAFAFGYPKLARKFGMCFFTEDVTKFFLRIVRETVTMREQQNIKRDDFMDLLIALKNNKSDSNGDGATKSIDSNDGDMLNGMTIEQVAAQAFVFFIAGFETSSTAMGYALYELARNQEIQDKLRKEINDVLTKHNHQFSYECMKDMHYLKQVISEILRLHTIVAHITRQALVDYTVPFNPKYKIDKGTRIIIPAAAIHHDPEYYPDPYTFNPDRFTPEMIAARESVLWLPFGDGPRNCIGMRFGQMQSYIGLVMLLKKFKFTVCSDTVVPMKYDPKIFILTAKGGIYLHVERV